MLEKATCCQTEQLMALIDRLQTSKTTAQSDWQYFGHVKRVEVVSDLHVAVEELSAFIHERLKSAAA